MDFTITSRNNSLYKKKKGTLGYKIESSASLKHVRTVTVSGMENIVAAGARYKANAKVSGVRFSTQNRAGTTTFTIRRKHLSDFFEFSFEDVWPADFSGDEKDVNLTISFHGSSGVLGSTTLEVYIKDNGPTIAYFNINPSFLNNDGSVELSWNCSNVEKYSIHYDDDTLIWPLSELPPVSNGKCSATKKLDSPILSNIGSATSIYLKAINGEKVASKNNKREIINVYKNAWTKQILGDNTPVLNLVGNEYDGKIWVLAQKEEGKIKLWNSWTGRDWQAYEDQENDTHVYVEQEDIYRPSVFFATSPTEPTELYFVGGSKLDNGEVSNQLISYDLNLSQKNTHRRQERGQGSAMPARMGHACFVFPDESGNNNIWVIGGADANGNGLNDIWRWDGVSWHQMPTPEDFPKRCQFSATVLNDDAQQMEIWLGGGLSAYQGEAINDIWRYYNKNGTWTWECVNKYEDLKVQKLTLGNTLNSSSLIALENRVFAIAMNKNGEGDFAKWIESQGVKRYKRVRYDCYNTGIQSFPVPEAQIDAGIEQNSNFLLQTLSFNGCIWLMAQKLISSNNIKLSELYYLVPQQN